jgi:hypothetical protein
VTQQPTGEMAVPADPDPVTPEMVREAIRRVGHEPAPSSRSRSCLPLALLGCLVLWGAALRWLGVWG